MVKVDRLKNRTDHYKQLGNLENDTIVAISTPPGEGGIGIVRMSGPESLNIALQIFVSSGDREKTAGKRQFNPVSKRLYYGYILDEQGNEIDEVLLSFMQAPHTYTREDIVEINAHGGVVPLRNILKLIIRKGARLAEPGEFTRRAYLNGRIDLLQAESILSIIRAKTEKGLKAAIQSLKGALSGEILKIRDDVVSILSEIEVDVDFSHEDIDFEGEHYQDIKRRIRNLKERMDVLLEKRIRGKILQEGLKTVIAGKPNVGKSSLYNYLVREERAIVTEVPGTTRDLLIEYINIKGVPLKLIDTAGLRKNGDRVEKIGMEFSKKAMEEADLLLFLLDAATGITAEDKWIYEQIPRDNRQSVIVILNKIDLKRELKKEKVQKNFPCKMVIETSLVTGEGLDQLEEAITDMVFSGDLQGEEGGLFLEARHGELISQAIMSLEDAIKALEQKYPLDIVSIDLRQVQQYLGNLLGEDTGEAVLDYIFQRFCIGK
jgi:tRNA modification GTPase